MSIPLLIVVLGVAWCIGVAICPIASRRRQSGATSLFRDCVGDLTGDTSAGRPGGGKPFPEAGVVARPATTPQIGLWSAIAAVVVLPTLAGCNPWQAPEPTAGELDAGLVVLYPGAYNSQWEMSGFYEGLRAAGRGQAIHVAQWAGHLEQWLALAGFFEMVRDWAKAEAARIAGYKAEHPGAPVTLISYSGGAMMAILVTEQMPEGTEIDRVILMSPGVSRHYDLGAMLARTVDGAVAYWSPVDDFAIGLVQSLGTVDGEFAEPAASFGFAATHDKLVQVRWEPEMAQYGNFGGHMDYLFLVPWIRDYVAPWVADTGGE